MWIEITEYGGGYRGTNVTPYAGVWIEIIDSNDDNFFSVSLPTRECGLKCGKVLKLLTKMLSLPTRECGLK